MPLLRPMSSHAHFTGREIYLLTTCEHAPAAWWTWWPTRRQSFLTGARGRRWSWWTSIAVRSVTWPSRGLPRASAGARLAVTVRRGSTGTSLCPRSTPVPLLMTTQLLLPRDARSRELACPSAHNDLSTLLSINHRRVVSKKMYVTT